VIGLTPTLLTTAKRLDLMWDVNMRATFLTSQACVPHLKKSTNPHILTMSPPLNLDEKWFAPHVAYTISKYGMSMCMLGMAHEFASEGIACNSLWPNTTIATAAIENNFPVEVLNASRHPSIVADAAYAILLRDSKTCSGNFFIDEEVLRVEGVTDFERYAVKQGAKLFADIFL
jgi:citronellol/citronellal dehydrogenase